MSGKRSEGDAAVNPSAGDAAGDTASFGGLEGEAERFDPTRDGPDLAYEHVHRYVLAARAVAGLRVLDLAAGTGYGSRILAESASSLVSLDLEPRHLRGVSEGVCGNALALPFRDDAFDAVVCFEAIEHVAEPATLIREARRVLGGPAIFIVSTPDREIYTDRAGHDNPYHIAEMTRAEFERALREDFGHVRLLGQGLWAGSWITGLGRGGRAKNKSKRSVDVVTRPLFAAEDSAQGEPGDTREISARWAAPDQLELPTPVYLLAACADSPPGWKTVQSAMPQESVLHDPRQWLLGQYDHLAAAWGGELLSFREELARAQQGHDDQSSQIEAARRSIGRLEEELAAAGESIRALESEVESARAAIGSHEREIEQARASAHSLDEQFRAAQASVTALEAELDTARSEAASQLAAVASLNSEVDRERKERNGLLARYEALESQRAEIEASAKASADSFEDQLRTSRAAIEAKEEEIAAAREVIAEKDSELERARRVVDTKEQEVSTARELVDAKDLELEASRRASTAQEAELDASRGIVAEKDAELDRAREVVDAKQVEIDTARNAIAEKDAELARSRTIVDAKESELSRARSVIDDKEREIEGARDAAADAASQIETLGRSLAAREKDLSAAQTAMAEGAVRRNALEESLRARATELERVQAEFAEEARAADAFGSRPLVRAGSWLADWADRLLQRGK